MFSVDELRNMSFDKNSKPYQFRHGKTEVPVANWANLSVEFVKWLIQDNYLTSENLPFPNYANRGKYFISTEKSEEYGDWQNVNGFFVNTKYNAESHIKNILWTQQKLGVPQKSFGISIYLK